MFDLTLLKLRFLQIGYENSFVLIAMRMVVSALIV